MKIFSPLYRRAMQWARHRHAPWYLGTLSFAESSFFPIPPDVMLAPMCLAQPRRAFGFALLTTLASVAGGLFGYLIGVFAFDAIAPWLRGSSYWGSYQIAENWFRQWGFWAVFVAGFSPIPYKVFTIAAGVLAMPLLPFALASLIGRGARFSLVAALMAWGGVRMETALHRYVDRIGWATVVAVVIGVVVYIGGGGQAPASAPELGGETVILSSPG
ncbi:MAG: DedA family protein [Azoarcus sp.]|nr:DedA family protein [Azoarcus sp.]